MRIARIVFFTAGFAILGFLIGNFIEDLDRINRWRLPSKLSLAAMALGALIGFLITSGVKKPPAE